MRKINRLCIGLISSILLFSCSSAPKVPPEIVVTRNEGGRLVQLGAKALREGAQDAARDYYTEAYRLFTLVDEPEGRIRALDGLSRFAPNGEELRAQAERIAQESGKDDLVALASLLTAEYDLHSTDKALVEKAAEIAFRGANGLSKRPMDKARALRIYASALKTLGRYPEALKVLDEAAGIDKGKRAYTEYASDKYLSASIYSKTDRYPEAWTNLWEALDYDRRAENAGGIGADYLAMALVSEKQGNREDAKKFLQRSLDVYTAARMKAQIEDIQNRLKNY
jgi:tetratricopeptide (TPR) repeat protein